jgi:hypothetical protein
MVAPDMADVGPGVTFGVAELGATGDFDAPPQAPSTPASTTTVTSRAKFEILCIRAPM